MKGTFQPRASALAADTPMRRLPMSSLMNLLGRRLIKALDFFQADKFKGVQIRVLLEHQDMQEV